MNCDAAFIPVWPMSAEFDVTGARVTAPYVRDDLSLMNVLVSSD